MSIPLEMSDSTSNTLLMIKEQSSLFRRQKYNILNARNSVECVMYSKWDEQNKNDIYILSDDEFDELGMNTSRDKSTDIAQSNSIDIQNRYF